jgi:hypothetical protein
MQQQAVAAKSVRFKVTSFSGLQYDTKPEVLLTPGYTVPLRPAFCPLIFQQVT